MRGYGLRLAASLGALTCGPVGPFIPATSAQVPATLPPNSPYAIGTFECLGIYYKARDDGECKVRFRPAGKGEFKEGLPLVYDARSGEYRGSLVYLTPGTEYEVELQVGGKIVRLAGRTRDEKFPVGRTTEAPAGDSYEPITITQSGTPEAYHLVTVPGGKKATIDIGNAAECAVVVDADYVIVRGLELRNAARHGVLIKKGRHDVVVEDCRITGWGRVGGPQTFGNEGHHDSAVYAEDGTRNLVVQRNLIEHPRGASNDWRTGHPAGPQGVTINQSGGGNILRHNTIRSSEDHGYNDAIGGSQNFSDVGNMNRDSDVYGNYIRNVWDDAIEVEGSNTNVRVWGNYIEKTLQHVASASTTHGPLYIFRNVFGESRRSQDDPMGLYMLKVGGRGEFDGGRRLVFHNTSVQPKGALHVFSGHVDPNALSRNNVWDCSGMLNRNRLADQFPKSDFDHDIFTGLDVGVPEMPNRVKTNPAFVETHALEFYPSRYTTTVQWGKVTVRRGGEEAVVTDPVVTVPNKMIDGGVRIPNFNDDHAGAAPDIGAFETGRPPLKFGREAAGAPAAPWE